MPMTIMREKDKRTSVITIRVAEKEKEQLERKASACHETLSSYMLNAGMAGVERQRKREQKRIQNMVLVWECINDIDRYINNCDMGLSKDVLQGKFNNLKQDVKKLWEN